MLDIFKLKLLLNFSLLIFFYFRNIFLINIPIMIFIIII